MGRRSRRQAGTGAPVATSDYADPDGNVLTLRDEVSAASLAKLREPAGGAAASADDLWQRRTEVLFERFAVRWTVAGLPIEKQKDLLARYRFADRATREWIRATLDQHVGDLG